MEYAKRCVIIVTKICPCLSVAIVWIFPIWPGDHDHGPYIGTGRPYPIYYLVLESLYILTWDYMDWLIRLRPNPSTYPISIIIPVILSCLALSLPLQCSQFSQSLSKYNMVDPRPSNNGHIIAINQLTIGKITGTDAFLNLCSCTNLTEPKSHSPVRLMDINSLDISLNNYTADQIPPLSITCLTGILILNLNGNFFPGGLRDGLIKSMPNLISLDISYCHIAGLTRTAMIDAPSLNTLSVEGNAFTTLPSDIFASNVNLRQIYLDNNLLLERLPSKIFNIPSIELVSHKMTPRLSCLPVRSPSTGSIMRFAPGGLPSCSFLLLFSSLVDSGDDIPCRHVQIRFDQGWTSDADLTELRLDMAEAVRIDSSRLVNFNTADTDTSTILSFDVLPNSRDTQVMGEYVYGALMAQLQDPNSKLRQGTITKQLDQSATVVDSFLNLHYCSSMKAYLPSGSDCGSPSDLLSWIMFGQPALYVVIAGACIGLTIGSVMALAFIHYRTSSKSEGHHPLPPTASEVLIQPPLPPIQSPTIHVRLDTQSNLPLTAISQLSSLPVHNNAHVASASLPSFYSIGTEDRSLVMPNDLQLQVQNIIDRSRAKSEYLGT